MTEISNTIESPMNSITTPISGRTFNDYASRSNVDGTPDFLHSNSTVAKVAFLILVLIIFVLLFRLGIVFISWLLLPSGSPHLIDGMIDAKQMKVIPQNPAINGSKPIKRSDNESDGIEFTWSVWVNIDNLEYGAGKYKHVFSKGDNDTTTTLGLSYPNNGPGLYIAPNKNDLVVIMNTFNVINEEIIIEDIPLNKWINVIIRCDGRVLDVYINGMVTKSHKLSSVPRQNYGDVYMSMNGGYNGYTSDLWYFDKAISIGKINSIVNKGPNTKLDNNDSSINTKPPKFSLRWYFSGNTDAYNP